MPTIGIDQAIQLTGKATFRDPIIKKNNSVFDTFNFIKSDVPKTASQTAELVKYFKAPTVRETAKNIFDFVKVNIAYVKDDVSTEQVRTPQRLLHDRRGDCDCFSYFILSCLYNLRIPAKLKMVKLNGNPDYQHIYVIVPDNAAPKGYWVIDPVLPNFDQEAKGITGEYTGGLGCVDCNGPLSGINGGGQINLTLIDNNIEPMAL